MTRRSPSHCRASAAVAAAAVTVAVLAAIAVLPGAATAQASPAWSTADVQAGSDPVLAVSPTGAATLGSTILGAHGATRSVEINLAAPAGAFTTTPYTLSAKQLGGSGVTLTSLGLAGSRYLAAGFENASDLAFSGALAKPAPSRFSTLTPIVSAAVKGAPRSGAATLQWLPTSRGELVGLAISNAGALSTPVISNRGKLLKAHAPSVLKLSDSAAEATDGAGGTFLAGDGYGTGGCTAVAYRAAGFRFVTTYTVAHCDASSPNSFDAITAGSSGYAAMLTEDLSESGARPSPLDVQVGRDGHFGAPVRLAPALSGQSVGLASDADGMVTAEWIGCTPGPVYHGVLSTSGCALQAATGSFTHGFSTRTTTLVSSTHGLANIATADRVIGLSRCTSTATSSCTVEAYTARAAGGFRGAVRLAHGARLVKLTANDHGVLLAVWETASGRLFAATGSATSGRFAAAHTLSAAAVSAGSVTAAVSSRGEALVAWSRAGRVFVARTEG